MKYLRAAVCGIFICSCILLGWMIVYETGLIEKAVSEKKETDSNNRAAETSEVVDQENGTNGSESLKSQLENIDKQIRELEKQQAAAGCEVHLYFDQVFESAYEQLYPVMSERGYTGTLVLTNGQLPGDNLQMTEQQCREMLDAGWELAVGGSRDIDMNGDLQDVMEEWSSYLEQYLEEIKTRMNIVPATYCFNEGEYREEFDQVLKEYGFTTIRYFGDGELESEKNGLIRIRGYRVTQEQENDAVKDLSGYSSVALSTRRVADEVRTPEEDIEIGKYGELLDSMHEAGMYIAGSDDAEEAKAGKEELSKQIDELKARKKEIEKQIQGE
ncbi:MAG: polysaccharide deacetylase family protein [Lachnospiraceae bacterium]|nr:polysaccharide deacetylase family protein [Lachnospiraceae bacterium]